MASRVPCVYILGCKGGMLYVGVTARLEHRVGEHAEGVGGATTRRLAPCRCLCVIECDTMKEAIALEKRIKGWRREKKIALIEGRFEDLPDLAQAYRDRVKTAQPAGTGEAPDPEEP
jgi:putative endonuclease